MYVNVQSTSTIYDTEMYVRIVVLSEKNWVGASMQGGMYHIHIIMR